MFIHAIPFVCLLFTNLLYELSMLNDSWYNENALNAFVVALDNGNNKQFLYNRFLGAFALIRWLCVSFSLSFTICRWICAICRIKCITENFFLGSHFFPFFVFWFLFFVCCLPILLIHYTDIQMYGSHIVIEPICTRDSSSRLFIGVIFIWKASNYFFYSLVIFSVIFCAVKMTQ